MAERNAEKRRTEERRITESIEGEKNGKRTNPDPHDRPASRVGAVVLAAGRGKRMQSRVPKQYMELCGKPLIFYAHKAFEDSPQIDEIVLITGPGETEQVRAEIVERFGFYKVSCVAEGGAERYHSVYEGLKCLEGADYVLIHDGARPLVDEGIISRCVSGAAAWDACVAAMPVKDTIKVADADGFSADTPDRSILWGVQTPQAFSYPLIREAYDRLFEAEENQRGITDDAMVAEKLLGTKVKLVEGAYYNMKVTTPEDILVAAALMEAGRDAID